MNTTSDANPPLAAPPCSAFVPRAGSFWLVEWIAEIDPANYQSATNSSAISSLPNDQSHRSLPGARDASKGDSE